MRLSIKTDALGGKSYYLVNTAVADSKPYLVSETRATLMIQHNEIENAYIDERTGEIKLTGGKQVIRDEAALLKMEAQVMKKLGNDKYEIVGLVRNFGKISAYRVKNSRGDYKSISVAFAIASAKLGYITNAKVVIEDGIEQLVGVGMSLTSLGEIDTGRRTTGKQKLEDTFKSADGVLKVDWEDVTTFVEKNEDAEYEDARSTAQGGMRYPRAQLLKQAKLTIGIQGVHSEVSVENFDELIADETTTLVVTTNYKNKNYRILCFNTNPILVTAYHIAVIALVGLRSLDMSLSISEVLLDAFNGSMWRLMYTDDENGSSTEGYKASQDDAYEVDKTRLKSLKSMYEMNVNALSASYGQAEQARLLRRLKLGTATIKVMADGVVYTTSDMSSGGSSLDGSQHLVEIRKDDNRIDIWMTGTDKSEVHFYNSMLSEDKRTLKNIIMICAAALLDRCEIKRISIESVDVDRNGNQLSYVIDFKSNKIRLAQ